MVYAFFIVLGLIIFTLGAELAKELVARNKNSTISSKQFIKAYIGSFANDPVFNQIAECKNMGDAPLS